MLLQALVDSEAEQNLIDVKPASKLLLPLMPLNPPIPATALNNQVFTTIATKLNPLM